MKPYFESIVMPDSEFPAKGFVTESMEHVLCVHPHWHAEVEVLYFESGSALQQVNDAIFTAEPGDIVVIGRDQLHSTYSSGTSSSRILVLQFDAGRLLAPAFGGGQPLKEAPFSNSVVYRNPICSRSGEGRAMLECVEEICGELASGRDAYRFLANSALYRLAGLLTRSGAYAVEPSSEGSVRSVHSMLERTFRLVDESFSEPISLQAAARASNLSTTHFCRMFRKTTGMTFHDYLTFYRVNRAEQMLPSDRKFAEIAFECGFGSVSSFIRNFKAYKGCAPSEYAHASFPSINQRGSS